MASLASPSSRCVAVLLLLLLGQVSVQSGSSDGQCPDGEGRCSAGAEESNEGEAPFLTVIYITKRPGGYDVLFESLAQQTSSGYELICIDDLSGGRHEQAREYALALKLPLAAILRSKAKVYGQRFGQCNAINSGLLLARGRFITVVQDNVWLPPTFVERTSQFFRTHPPGVLLSYPERRVAPPPGRLQRALMEDKEVMSVFSPPVATDPLRDGFEVQDFNNTMTEDVFLSIGREAFIRTEWFECAACTASRELYQALNGLDEALDVGDDSQEANVKDRAMLLAADSRAQGLPEGLGQVWNDLGSPVVLIDHHQFETDETWARFEKDTNVHRWRGMKDLIELGDYPLRAPNNFDLKVPRPALLASATHSGPEAGPITGVDWAGVPVRQAPGGEAAQVAAVMGGRFGYKPEVLFAYALSPEDEARWDGALRAALRLLRRHFHMTLMNVHHLRIEDGPDIDFQIKPTFHFFLGWGPLFGKVDYFLRQYSEKENPKRKEKGQQLARFGLFLRGGGPQRPDGDARDVYQLFVYPTAWDAEQVAEEYPDINVHHAIGVDAGRFAPSSNPRDTPKPHGPPGRSALAVVGDVSWAARVDTLAEEPWLAALGRGGVVAMRDEGDVVSEEIRSLLAQHPSAEVVAFPGAEERAELYRGAASVLFPMSEEGGGEWELLEALASGAKVAVAEDNAKLQWLLAHFTKEGGPDVEMLTRSLVVALWSVLSSQA